MGKYQSFPERGSVCPTEQKADWKEMSVEKLIRSALVYREEWGSYFKCKEKRKKLLIQKGTPKTGIYL